MNGIPPALAAMLFLGGPVPTEPAARPAGSPAAHAVTDVRISISLDGDRALVNASYTLETVDPDLTWHTIRDDGVLLAIEVIEGARLELEARAGGWVLSGPVESGATVHLRYRVTGVTRRVPIFVPTEPMREDGATEIRLDGVAADVRPSKAFPRMTREPGGELVARLRDPPSFVRLPPSGLAVNDLLDALVVLVILLAIGLWLRRIRRRATA